VVDQDPKGDQQQDYAACDSRATAEALRETRSEENSGYAHPAGGQADDDAVKQDGELQHGQSEPGGQRVEAAGGGNRTRVKPRLGSSRRVSPAPAMKASNAAATQWSSAAMTLSRPARASHPGIGIRNWKYLKRNASRSAERMPVRPPAEAATSETARTSRADARAMGEISICDLVDDGDPVPPDRRGSGRG